MYKNVLITTDLSDLAKKGVIEGLELATALGAKATILTVTEPLSSAALHSALEAGVEDPVGLYEIQIDRELTKRLQKLEETTHEYSIEIQLRNETDEHPAESIVRFAEENGHDLIVMTTHGHRGFKKMILGSQTSEVLVTTKIPVLVVR